MVNNETAGLAAEKDFLKNLEPFRLDCIFSKCSNMRLQYILNFSYEVYYDIMCIMPIYICRYFVHYNDSSRSFLSNECLLFSLVNSGGCDFSHAESVDGQLIVLNLPIMITANAGGLPGVLIY